MTATVHTPDDGELDDVVRVLGGWQRDDAPIQLHPGDLGWQRRFGVQAAAAATRTWSREGTILAVGVLDGPDVFRMTVAPEVWRDDEFARTVVRDLSAPERGVLPAGKASVEVPDGSRLRDLLTDELWVDGEPWTPLRLDLAAPLGDTGVHTEVVVSATQVAECTAVHRAAWGSQHFTDEKWRTMSAGLPFTDALCLLARDDQGIAVATVTVWSAGPGRPALIEPLGVHVDHRRRGFGVAICRAAASGMQELGSSSLLVCTESSRDSAVATYEAAGFERLAERLDRTRNA